MDNRLYKLGCKTGLLNYIDHETPRFYFINANADLDDFDAFCAEITEEYAAEIDQLREALHGLLVRTPLWLEDTKINVEMAERYREARKKAYTALGEKE